MREERISHRTDIQFQYRHKSQYLDSNVQQFIINNLFVNFSIKNLDLPEMLCDSNSRPYHNATQANWR